jgi:hypothetical protein
MRTSFLVRPRKVDDPSAHSRPFESRVVARCRVGRGRTRASRQRFDRPVFCLGRRSLACRGRARPPPVPAGGRKMAARTPLLLRGANCFRKHRAEFFHRLRNCAEKFCLRAVMAIAKDERNSGVPVFRCWLLRGPSRLAFWRTMSSGRVKVRLRLRDGLLAHLNIRHRHQDWA